MYRFFETFKIENGKVCNSEYHLRRMLRTANDFNLDYKVISESVDTLLSISTEKNNSRCKLMYDNHGFDFEFSQLKTRSVASLKIVFDDFIDYSYKFSNRCAIDSIYAQRQDCDDVLIVKNGRITDASIANVLLYDGKSWVTPDCPLLNGTCRQRLIDEARIEARQILFSDLKLYSSLMLINALRDFNEAQALNISSSIKY